MSKKGRQAVWGKSFKFLKFSLLCKMQQNDHPPLPVSAGLSPHSIAFVSSVHEKLLGGGRGAWCIVGPL